VPSDSAAYSEVGDVDTESNETSGSRKKRQTDGGGPTTCLVMLVADYRFYTNVGGSDLKATTNYMVGVCVCKCVCMRSCVCVDASVSVSFFVFL